MQSKPRVAIIADVSGPAASAIEDLERMDLNGEIELEPMVGLGNELALDALNGFDAVVTRPGAPELSPEHLKNVNNPFFVVTLSVGRSHLERIEAMNDVKIIAPVGTNAEGTAALALIFSDLLVRPVQIGCEQMKAGLYDRRPFDESRRSDGLEWLVIGAGHVVQSMIWGIVGRNPKQITVWNRSMTLDRFAQLISDVPSGCRDAQISVSDNRISTIMLGKKDREIPFIVEHGEFRGQETSIEAIRNADVVSLNIDCNKHTAGVCGREFINRMKPGALLINVGRGELVDEEAVVEALKYGQLGGYGADVVYQQAENNRHHLMSPVWSQYVSDQQLPIERRQNIILTPHVGGHVFPDILQTAGDAIDSLISQLRVR
jgi:phosphoglycerate dehydrogenase-like enzyme